MAGQDKSKAADAGVAQPAKKSPLVPILAAVAGIALGGGGAAGYFLTRPPAGANAETQPAEEKGADADAAPEFVDLSRLTVPMIDPAGKLKGYMNLDLKLEVPASEVEFTKARVPIIRHAINETVSGTSVADPKNPELLDYKRTEKLLMDAVNAALGKQVVQSVQVVAAMPL